ncbi:hypothetical protein GEMRC1_001916 [Eukaryota sp. GEM-RC1]
MSLIPYDDSDIEEPSQTALADITTTTDLLQYLPTKPIPNTAGNVAEHSMNDRSFKRIFYQELNDQRKRSFHSLKSESSEKQSDSVQPDSTISIPPTKTSRVKLSRPISVFHGESLKDYLGRSWLFTTHNYTSPSTLLIPSKSKLSIPVQTEDPLQNVLFLPFTNVCAVVFTSFVDVYEIPILIQSDLPLSKKLTLTVPFSIAHMAVSSTLVAVASFTSLVVFDVSTNEVVHEETFEFITAIAFSKLDSTTSTGFLFICSKDTISALNTNTFSTSFSLIEEHGSSVTSLWHLPSRVSQEASTRETILTFSESGVVTIRRKSSRGFEVVKSINSAALSKRATPATDMFISGDLTCFCLAIPEGKTVGFFDVVMYRIEQITERRDKFRAFKVRSNGKMCFSYSEKLFFSVFNSQVICVNTATTKPCKMIKSGNVTNISSHDILPVFAVCCESSVVFYQP